MQEELEKGLTEASKVAKEVKLAKKEALQELNEVQQKCTELGREVEELKIQMAIQTQTQQRLTLEVDIAFFY